MRVLTYFHGRIVYDIHSLLFTSVIVGWSKWAQKPLFHFKNNEAQWVRSPTPYPQGRRCHLWPPSIVNKRKKRLARREGISTSHIPWQTYDNFNLAKQMIKVAVLCNLQGLQGQVDRNYSFTAQHEPISSTALEAPDQQSTNSSWRKKTGPSISCLLDLTREDIEIYSVHACAVPLKRCML